MDVCVGHQHMLAGQESFTSSNSNVVSWLSIAFKGSKLENKIFFQLKSKRYRDGIKRKVTREGWDMNHCT